MAIAVQGAVQDAARDAEREDADDRVDLGELASALVRRWLTVLGCFVPVVGAALIYLVAATPSYKATTSILLDPRGGAALTSPDTNATRLSQDTNLIESQVRLVTSPAVLGRVVTAQRLVEDPEFGRGEGGPGLLARLRGLAGQPGAASGDAARAREQLSLAALAEHVDVKRSERTLILDLEVRSVDPAKAARLADAIAASFVDDQLAAKASASTRESGRLDERLRTLETRIRDGERRIEAFRARNSILDVSNGQQGEQQLNELNSQAVRAAQAVSDARARLAQVQRLAASGGGSLDSMPDGLRSNTITTLRSQYADAQRRVDTLSTTLGSLHPDLAEARSQLRGVQAQITAELQRIALGLRNEVDVAAASEAAAAKALDAKKREIGSTNGVRVDLRTLERAVAADRATYDRLLSADTTLQQESAPVPIARQLAPALMPLRPASPNVRAILLIASALGLALGLGAALVAEGRSRRRPAGEPSGPAEPALPQRSAAPEPRRPAAAPISVVRAVPEEVPIGTRRHIRRFHGGSLAANPATHP